MLRLDSTDYYQCRVPDRILSWQLACPFDVSLKTSQAVATNLTRGSNRWLDKYKPRNRVPWTIIIISYSICVVMMLAIRWRLSYENKQRDILQAQSSVCRLCRVTCVFARLTQCASYYRVRKMSMDTSTRSWRTARPSLTRSKRRLWILRTSRTCRSGMSTRTNSLVRKTDSLPALSSDTRSDL
jgi:hypothetical protein